MVRLLSAAVLIAVVVVTLWALPAVATLAVAALVASLAAFEVAGLFGKLGAPVPSWAVACAAAVTCIAFAMAGRGQPDALGLVMLALIVMAGLTMLAGGPPRPATAATAAALVMIPVYVGLPLGAIAWIQAARGPLVLTALVVVVIVSDSAQYAVGRAAGRRKLAPAVSPAKTVEGAVGGLLGAALAGAVLATWAIPGVGWAGGAVLGAALGAFGLAGDLFESLLKRSAGVKDSSHLIPGHGGVLDRIDSWLFAAPAYYVFLRYFV